MTTRILGIVVAVACSLSGTAKAATNLKPFDPVALQGVVETTAKEPLLLPGGHGSVAHATGRFAFGYGSTELERRALTAGRHAFPDRLEHQDDDGRGDRAAGPGRKIAFRRCGLEIC